MRPLNSDWTEGGYKQRVFQKMKDIDEEQFFIQTRMSLPVFNLLLSLVESKLRKPKQRIFPEERLAITLK